VTRLRRVAVVAGALACAACVSTHAASASAAPSAPRNVWATAGAGSATVRWQAPVRTGGSKITSYWVTPYLGSSAQPTRRFRSAATTQVISGLTSDRTYRFRVAARNASGTGPRSAASNAVTIGGPCRGVRMTRGQPDIAAHGPGTTFCLSGTHNWSLTPKARDRLIGPAILDGHRTREHAIVARAPNVTLARLTIRHYINGDQDGAIHIDDDDHAKATASGWHLNHLNVGFNSNSGAGTGNGWIFTGGRFHDNHQEGIGGAMGHHVTINGTEIDHNDFTDTRYTKRKWDCGDEAGGVKWVTNYMTIKNSNIHNNACKGIWADLGASYTTITGNRVYNNWDEGIFIEISSRTTITGNVVTGNGKKNYNGDGSGCPWLFGGGITLNSSDHVVIAHNTLSGNCNGITGIQQDRPDGNPGLLQDVSIHDNTVAGPGGVTGVSSDNGSDLRNRNIAFSNNKFKNRMSFCRYGC
jgi:parallel beta-helix repeat protein